MVDLTSPFHQESSAVLGLIFWSLPYVVHDQAPLPDCVLQLILGLGMENNNYFLTWSMWMEKNVIFVCPK